MATEKKKKKDKAEKEGTEEAGESSKVQIL